MGAHWSPPQDCECVETTRTDGLIWLPSCSRVPESNETPYCYVNPESCPSAVSNEFSDEFQTVVCKQFTYWIAPTGDNYPQTLPPIKSFIESELPEWKQAEVYDFETIDLVIIHRGTGSGSFFALPFTKHDLINDIEARNVAVAMLGHNILDLDFGLRQTTSTSQGVVSTLHFPEAGGLSEPIVFQATDDIITSGFENGQSVSMAKKLSSYTTSLNWYYHYLTPLYDPTGDYETIAYTKRVNHPNFADVYDQPALVRHKNRPIITVPWGTFAIFVLVLLVSVSFCVSCRRKKSAKESNDYKTEIICASNLPNHLKKDESFVFQLSFHFTKFKIK